MKQEACDFSHGYVHSSTLNKVTSQVENSTKDNASSSGAEMTLKKETDYNDLFYSNVYSITDNETKLQYLTLSNNKSTPMTLRIDKDGKPYIKDTHGNFTLKEVARQSSLLSYVLYVVKDLDTGVEYIVIQNGAIQPRLNINGLPYIKP